METITDHKVSFEMVTNSIIPQDKELLEIR